MSILSWLTRRRLDLDEQDFQDEIRAHLAIAEEERVADGTDHESAHYALPHAADPTRSPGSRPRRVMCGRAWMVRECMRGNDVTNRTRSTSRVVLLGACLVAFSALLLLLAPVGYRLGFLSLRFALLTVLRWGAYVAIAGAAVSVAGLVVTLLRPREMRRGAALAVISIVAALALIAIPGRFRLGPPAPPIHDITTDTQNPPGYVAVLPLRANAPNTTEYGGEKIAAQQRRAYPDIQPLALPDPPARAFERALAAVREMGWELVEANPAEGRIEATDATFWFGFKDDVAIRVTAADGGSRVDVRSLSRVGGGDAGTNAKRIREYVKALQGE